MRVHMNKSKHKIGRPTKYSQELAQLICKRIATHTESLKKLCARYDDMPSHDTINEWRWEYHEFSDQYLVAKNKQMDLIIEECEELVDDILYYTDAQGNKRVDPGSVNKQIAKINLRKWHASKLAPKLYGNKQILDNPTDSNETKQELLDIRAQLASQSKKEY